jgi:hypothetical protein
MVVAGPLLLPSLHPAAIAASSMVVDHISGVVKLPNFFIFFS